MNDPESKRRGPVRYALAVVVVLTASGIVLREWGPINPAISVITQVGTPAEHDAGLDQQFGPGGFGGTSLTIGPDRTLHVWLSMTNQSHSTVRVVGARVRSEDGDGAPGLLLVRVSGVPRSIDRNEAAYVDVVINFTRACANAARERPPIHRGRRRADHIRPHQDGRRQRGRGRPMPAVLT